MTNETTKLRPTIKKTLGTDLRAIWIFVAVISIPLFVLWDPGDARYVVETCTKLAFLLGLAAVLAYQSFDDLRSAWAGPQSKVSVPKGDASKASARVAGLIWGLMSGLLAIGVASWGLWSELR